MTHSSPSSTARQLTAARSEPTFGSDNDTAARYSPRAALRVSSTRFSSGQPRDTHDAAGARDDAGDAHPAAREFLRDQAVLEHAEPEAAVLFRRANAEIAEFAHLAAQVHRNLALHRVEFVGHRQHFLHRELARRRLNHQAFFGQVRDVIGHRSTFRTGRRDRAGSARCGSTRRRPSRRRR